MSVAVIGAGIAGISAALQLHEAGLAVELFDKSRGTGGRMSSKRTEQGEFDIGTQYFTARHSAFRAAVEDWQSRGWVARWQPRLYRIDEQGLRASEDDQQRYVGAPRMTALSRSLIGDIPLHSATRIVELQRSEAGWLLVDSEAGHHGPYQQVIVATPAPQAVPLLSAAPTLASAAAQAQMEPGWAVCVGFAEPLTLALDAAFVRCGPLDWVCANHSKPGRDSAANWVLQSTPAWAAAHLDTPPQEVATLLLEALADALQTELPEVRFVHAHRWLYARPAEDQQWGALAAPELDLYVCGDWCQAGRLEGAWLSGREAAQVLLGRS
tara:strand:+ start:10174 stop:11148 length:975 start_codon:yes stop_codon:yes gene_type:complete